MSKLIWPLILIGLLAFLTFGPIDTQFKKAASEYTGLTTIKIPVSGTGSMYPTFPKGKGKTPQEQADELVAEVDMYAYPNPRFKIGHGDIVEFRNAKTDEIESKEFGEKEVAGFVKRIVGIPGDALEIRDGQLLINGEAVKEPYTAVARSTFGGEFLADCTKLIIPEGKYFVMGDNRKASNDSRHDVGLIDEKDIGFILPLAKQTGVWDKNWRDIANDNSESSRIKLNKQEYVNFLNSLRSEAGLKPLKYIDKLESSARYRGQNIIYYDDFSFEATKSGYTIDKAFSDSGYWNPVKGESVISGYYSADELIEGLSEFKKTNSVVTDPEIQEIGISEVQGEINGCPTQVIVQHFAGYVPPNYSADYVNSFKNGLANLKQISSSWNSLKTDDASFYEKNKADVDQINQIILNRINRLEPIVGKITANQWLTPSENEYLKEDQKLIVEQNAIADRINKAIQTFR